MLKSQDYNSWNTLTCNIFSFLKEVVIRYLNWLETFDYSYNEYDPDVVGEQAVVSFIDFRINSKDILVRKLHTS